MPARQSLKKLSVNHAIAAYAIGNGHKAELICRELLDLGYRDPIIYNLLALIAFDIGKTEFGKNFLCQAWTASTACREDIQLNLLQKGIHDRSALASLPADDARPFSQKSGPQKFLLIKSWGFGFWSDIDHLLGFLLLAELTGRVPIVIWGANSLYNPGVFNAFNLYFEPVSHYTIDDIIKSEISIYPPKWNRDNLLTNNLHVWEGPYSGINGIEMLSRHEDLIVGDFYTSINDLIPWIEADHPYFGKESAEMYQTLIEKYLNITPEILHEIDAFYSRSGLMENNSIAVHVRGGNKAREDKHFVEFNRQFDTVIQSYLDDHPKALIFLLTNDLQIERRYTKRYGDRLIMTDCLRTEDNSDAHYNPEADRFRLGKEVLIDTIIASRCDGFVGYGWSTLACMIKYIKSWPEGACKVLGKNITTNRLFYDKHDKILVPVKLFFDTLKSQSGDSDD